MSRKTSAQLFVLVFLSIFAFYSFNNATRINDWLHSLSYTPSAEIVKLAEDAGMNETGQRYFFRYEPKLLSESEIKETCGFGEVVLGCFNDRGIFIVDYNTAEEYNRTLVTAAHEMLHVAYYRQGKELNSSLYADLENALEYSDLDIKEEINSYTEKDARYDEAFALIGSQQEKTPENLEKVYEQYFSDRSLTLDAFNRSPEAN